MKNNVLKLIYVATLGGFLFGYDTAVINGAVGPLSDYFSLSPEVTGFATASALIGCVIGSAISGILSSRLGRKLSLIIAAILFLISAIGCALPESIEMLIVFRIIGGIGVGLASMVSPMYIAEISLPRNRGKYVSYYQLAVVIGIQIVFFVNYAIAQVGSREWIDLVGWRWMFASEALPAIAFLIFLFFVSDSPRWFAMKNMYDKARSVLEKIRGTRDVDEEINEIKHSLTIGSGSDKAILSEKKVPFLILIGILLSFFQQVTGINVIMYYGTEIFRSMGEGINQALFQSALVGAVNLIFTIVAIRTIDKFGRKPLLIIGSIGMFLSISTLGTLIYFNQFGIPALISVLVFIASFAMSMGPVVWVLISEIFPNRIRNFAMPIAVAAQWVSNFLVTQTFPVLEHYVHSAFPFWLYGFMCLVAIAFTVKYIPETKGRSLEEMEKVFGIGRE